MSAWSRSNGGRTLGTCRPSAIDPPSGKRSDGRRSKFGHYGRSKRQSVWLERVAGVPARNTLNGCVRSATQSHFRRREEWHREVGPAAIAELAGRENLPHTSVGSSYPRPFFPTTPPRCK